MKVLPIVGALLGLAACNAQQCDPSQAGFLSGIGCEASGSYGIRNQYQKSELGQRSADALQSRVRAQDEGARASEAMVTRDQARQRLGAVDRQAAEYRARINAARTRGGVDQVRLTEAQNQLNALRRQRAALRGDATEPQLRDLEAQRRRLNEQISGI